MWPQELLKQTAEKTPTQWHQHKALKILTHPQHQVTTSVNSQNRTACPNSTHATAQGRDHFTPNKNEKIYKSALLNYTSQIVILCSHYTAVHAKITENQTIE